MKKSILLLGFAILIAGGQQTLAQEQSEIDFVTGFFNQLQPKSIAENREYCGFFGFDQNGDYIATKPTKGDEGNCFADDPPLEMDIFASYHTHGAFSLDFDSEVPSSNDLSADIAEETDGYVATPGGRIWFNSTEDQKAHIICGRSCTVSDSNYDISAVKSINNSYSLDQLVQREDQ